MKCKFKNVPFFSKMHKTLNLKSGSVVALIRGQNLGWGRVGWLSPKDILNGYILYNLAV